MVKNIAIILGLLTLCFLTSKYVELKLEVSVYELMISTQRTQLVNLEYQLNQCRTLYIGL